MTGPAADLGDGPRCVFADKRFLVIQRFVQGGQIVLGADIAQGHADIAEEAAPFGPEDGRVAEQFLEAAIVEGKELAERAFEEGGVWLQLRVA